MKNFSLGSYLKQLRRASGYTQEFAASRLEISRQEYSHYETGRAMPSPRSCRVLAELYGISPEELLNCLAGAGHPSEKIIRPSSADQDFLDFLESKENAERLARLSRKEKELIFYFENISSLNQDEILEILRIKYKNRRLS